MLLLFINSGTYIKPHRPTHSFAYYVRIKNHKNDNSAIDILLSDSNLSKIHVGDSIFEHFVTET